MYRLWQTCEAQSLFRESVLEPVFSDQSSVSVTDY